jgi:hypothetical protein
VFTMAGSIRASQAQFRAARDDTGASAAINASAARRAVRRMALGFRRPTARFLPSAPLALWGARDSNPARRVKSPLLCLMS